MHSPHSKKDNGVSSIIGTIVLLALVVIATGIVAVNVVSNIGNTAQEGAIVSFEVSADPTLLYHAGGDTLYWDETIIYHNGKDITNYTFVGTYLGDLKYALDEVETWSTGQFIKPYDSKALEEAIHVSEILIISIKGGKSVVLYSGSEYKGGEPAKEYRITVINEGTGTVTVSHTSASAGDTITFTVDRTADTVNIVSGTGSNTVEYTQNGNEYTFTMPASDVIIQVSFETASYPYFRWGQNNSTDADSTEYRTAKELIEAINKWRPGTITDPEYSNGDNTVSGILAKDIPLENQSLVIGTGWDITLTSYQKKIWASPKHDKGVSLIVINDNAWFKVKSGTLNLDGNGFMKNSVVRLIGTNSNLITDYSDAKLTVTNGYNSSFTTQSGGGIYNKGTINGNISVSNCKAVNGGGIYNEYHLTLGSSSVIYGNTADAASLDNGNGMGGGICNKGEFAIAEIDGADVLSNYATGSTGKNTIASGGGIANLNGAILRLNNHALVSQNLAKYRGGGIYTLNGAKTYINNTTISSNHASAGGGVHNHLLFTVWGDKRVSETYINGGTIILENVVGDSQYSGFNFYSNWSGGGIYNDANITFTGNIVIRDNVCNTNNGEQGGGGIANSMQSAGNDKNIFGRIIVTEGSSVIIENNRAYYGGGVFIKDSVAVINMTILNNTANKNGGGIYVWSGGANINGDILNNTVLSNNNDNGGGGLYIEKGTVYVNKTVSNNTANTDGGGIYVKSGTVYVNDTVSDNVAKTNGGGVYNKGNLIVYKSGKLYNNSAFDGGGIYNSGTAQIYGEIGNDDSSISNNASNCGGGIYSTGGSSSKVFIEDTGKVMFNKAVKNGGGISGYDNTQITVNGSVYNNTVDAGSNTGNWYGLGGGIYINPANLIFNSGKINNNSALTKNNNENQGLGGGIYSGDQAGDMITINGETVISNNNATKLGGGILSKGVTIVSAGADLTMDYNKAKSNGGSAINVASGTFTNYGTIHGIGNAAPQVVGSITGTGNIDWTQ